MEKGIQHVATQATDYAVGGSNGPYNANSRSPRSPVNGKVKSSWDYEKQPKKQSENLSLSTNNSKNYNTTPNNINNNINNNNNNNVINNNRKTNKKKLKKSSTVPKKS